jgi:hypothetical protein
MLTWCRKHTCSDVASICISSSRSSASSCSALEATWSTPSLKVAQLHTRLEVETDWETITSWAAQNCPTIHLCLPNARAQLVKYLICFHHTCSKIQSQNTRNSWSFWRHWFSPLHMDWEAKLNCPRFVNAVWIKKKPQKGIFRKASRKPSEPIFNLRVSTGYYGFSTG